MSHNDLSEFFGEPERMSATLAKALSPAGHLPLAQAIGPNRTTSAPPPPAVEQHSAPQTGEWQDEAGSKRAATAPAAPARAR